MNSLSERQKIILRKLLVSVEPVSIEKMSEEFNRGVRSLRYDLAEIKRVLYSVDVPLRLKPKQGYYIHINDKSIIYPLVGLRQEDMKNPDEINERVKQLIYFLFVARNPVTTQECADALFLSQSSIQRLIKLIPSVTEYEIEIRRIKNNGIELYGDEHRIRSCVKKLCVESLESYYSVKDYYVLLPKWISAKLSLVQFKEILNTIKKVNEEYEVWISEYALIHLLVYVSLSKIRIEQGKMMEKIHDHTFLELNDEYDYAQTIFARLLIGEINPYELEGLVKQLISEGVFVHSSKDVFGSMLPTVVDKMIDYLKSQYSNLCFDYVTLASDLSKHLYLYVKRSRIGFNQGNNPLLQKVKEEYPLQYQIAENMYEIFMKHFDFELSESEVSFLAIYLYKNQQEQQSRIFKIYVVCSSSKGFSELIVTRVKHVFPQIEVVGILAIDQILTLEDFSNIDFVLSTIPLKSLKVPIIHITTLFNVKDIEQVQRFINYGISQKAIPEIKHDITTFIQNKYEQINDLEINTLVDIEEVSSCILSLFDVFMDFSDQYKITHDKMLGVMIHILLAIPRWLNPKEDSNRLASTELVTIELNNGLLAERMNDVFNVLQMSLNVRLSDQEKLSFYDYIIEKD